MMENFEAVTNERRRRARMLNEGVPAQFDDFESAIVTNYVIRTTKLQNLESRLKDLGVRTLFNILGPLTNPAGAKNQVMGVFHPDLVGIQVRALQRLGTEHAVVVYG